MPGQALLGTKYQPPAVPRGAIDRPDLVARLADPPTLTVVSGPAGYGKTTMVAAGLATGEGPVAWLTLEDSDNDPAVFVAYLVAAVARACPDIDTAAMDDAASRSASAASLVPLLNALAEIGIPLVVVLDDYHVIVDEAIHGLVAFLVTHAPPAMRLVLVTRADPPLPLARLRAHGALGEVRADDLRFTAGEAHRFLSGSMGIDLTEEASARLAERTEGWIAGLQLAGLSLRGRDDPDAFVAAFDASDRYIFDYLTDEALAWQPPGVRAFLEATCVLDQLTGPLCDALTGRDDGAAMLAALADANVFIQPLDERRERYRYHRLFADLLASGLDAGRRAELHRAAAAWLGDHGQPAAAIPHHLAAGDPEAAASCIEAVIDHVLARGELRTVGSWCRALPTDVLAGRPALGVVMAWAQFLQGDLAGAEQSLGRLDDRALAGHGPSRARLACLRAWFANRHDSPDAEALARTAIAGLPEEDAVFRSLAWTTLGESLVGRDAPAAAEAFGEAHRLASVARRSALLVGTVYSLVVTDLVVGHRRAAEERARGGIAELGDPGGVSPPWIGMLHLPLGVALYEADRLESARQHIATGHALCEKAGLRVTMLGAADWQEIMLLHLLGEPNEAWRRLDAVSREGDRHGIPRIRAAMQVLAAELLLREGDPAGARDRVDPWPREFDHVLGNVRDRATEVRGRLLLALGRPEEAVRMLEALAREQRAGGRRGRLIRTLVSLSVGNMRVGETPAAAAALAEAIGLAAPEDWLRPFREAAAPLAGQLPAVRHLAPAFVDELRGPVGQAAPERSSEARFDESGDMPLVETLSVREVEVLRLVAAGLSNEEIGRALFVTGGTAKWHVHNVLAKLGCRNRVGLVARARSLGLV
jgi:LuxR family maltose regulon positive regulatory protein